MTPGRWLMELSMWLTPPRPPANDLPFASLFVAFFSPRPTTHFPRVFYHPMTPLLTYYYRRGLAKEEPTLRGAQL